MVKVAMCAYDVVLAETVRVEGFVAIGFDWVVLDVVAEMDVLIFDVFSLRFVWTLRNRFGEFERCRCSTLKNALHFVGEIKRDSQRVAGYLA